MSYMSKYKVILGKNRYRLEYVPIIVRIDTIFEFFHHLPIMAKNNLQNLNKICVFRIRQDLQNGVN
jgi:hypothetical protein